MDTKEIVESIIIMFKLTYGKNIIFYEDSLSYGVVENDYVIFRAAKKPIGKTYRISDTIAVFHLEIEKIFNYGISSLEYYYKVGK